MIYSLDDLPPVQLRPSTFGYGGMAPDAMVACFFWVNHGMIVGQYWRIVVNNYIYTPSDHLVMTNIAMERSTHAINR